MSYYIPIEAHRCFYILKKLYDFKNYDYGDEELNEYAQTLDEDWFISKSNSWHKAYSDFINFYICGGNLCTIKHYVFSRENKEGFQLVIKDKKYKYIQDATPEEYAEYIFNNVLSPERLIPRLAKMLKEKIEKEKELRIQKEKEEYPYHPERWSSEERIEKFVEGMWEYNNDTNCYSDSMSDFYAHEALVKSNSRIEKAMSDDEFMEAAIRYKKKYKHNIKERLVSFN